MTEKTCKNCLHYEACKWMYKSTEDYEQGIAFDVGYTCPRYSPKSEWVHLPVKVGDTVYQIDSERVYQSVVKEIIYDASDICFDLSAIGQSIFLSREEAEAALKREEGKANEPIH